MHKTISYHLPGSQAKERFDEESTEHLQLLFSHKLAAPKEGKKFQKDPSITKVIVLLKKYKLILTSTHFLRAKSRPHPWTKSFCNSWWYQNLVCYELIMKVKMVTEGINKPYIIYLYHMPYTTPWISWEYRGHDLNKSEHFINQLR